MTGFGYETATTFGMDTVDRTDKRFSQLFFTAPNPNSKVGRREEDSAETKRRVDQRFTQPFSMTPGPGSVQDAKKGSSKSGLRSRLRNFFSSPTSPKKQETSPTKAQHRPSSIINTTLSTSSSSNKSTSTKKAELGTNAKTLKKLGPVTVNPPLPSFSWDSIFLSETNNGKGKGKRISSIHDSKFSSISSLPSLASLTLPSSTSSRTSMHLLHVSFPTLQILHSSLRRLKRGLKQQEYLTTHLSNNLVFLFGRKERQIEGWKRVKKEDREILLRAVFRVKDGVKRVFLRKAGFLLRSLSVLAQLEENLTPSKDLLQDTHSEDSTAGPSSVMEAGVEISPETIRDFIGMLHADLGNQKALDVQLRQIVCGPSVETWAVRSVNERIMVKRFVQFVEGRLDLLEGVYERLESVRCMMEGCLGEGKLED